MAFGIFLLAILYPCIVWEQRITSDTILSSINWMALQQTTIFFTSFELEKLCSHFTTPPFSPFMEPLQQILQAPKSVLLEKFLFYSNPPVNSQTKFYNQNKKKKKYFELPKFCSLNSIMYIWREITYIKGKNSKVPHFILNFPVVKASEHSYMSPQRTSFFQNY